MSVKKKSRVVFYINNEDKILLQNQCELLQIKTSFFIRNAVLEKLNKPVFEVKNQKIETKKYVSNLLKIGNNLNQISRKLNSGQKLNLKDENEVIKDINNIKNHILEIKSIL